MKSIKFFFSFFVLVLLNIGCGSSCDDGDLTESANKISAAATVYGSDPTKENCLAYKAALEAYINEVDDCDNVNEAAIQSYKDSVAALNCN